MLLGSVSGDALLLPGPLSPMPVSVAKTVIVPLDFVQHPCAPEFAANLARYCLISLGLEHQCWATSHPIKASGSVMAASDGREQLRFREGTC